MAYASWSVSALEVPNASKWNILGTNDAFFNSQVGTDFSSGTTSKVWWEELGRATVSVAGDTITLSSIAARKYLQIRFFVTATGGTTVPTFRFNNDSGSNYAIKYSQSFGASATATSQTSLSVATSSTAAIQFGVYDVINIASQRKVVMGQTNDDNAGNATTTCATIDVFGKWSNTSDQITRVDIVNGGGSGDFAIGSEILVLGHD